MHHRRPTAIAALLVALAAPLSACGFDYPTDRVNTIAAGVTDRDGSVDALGIRIFSTERGSGRLIGSLANNTDETASLDSVTVVDGEPAEFEPVEVEPRGGVNLAAEDTTPIPVTGDFAAGEFVEVELGFSTGESYVLNVPVVKNCWQYTEVPTPAESEASEASEAGEGATDETEEAGSSESAAAEESAEVVDEPTDVGSTDDHSLTDETDPAYACEQDLAHEGH